MHKGRVEAFSDGVFAIIITIMVLELKVPHGAEWHDLIALWPVFLSYVLSFVNVGVYWNNHHHMFQAVKTVTGGVLWANLFLLFWLSLMPFATAWMGENHFATLPVAVYGFDLFMCGVGYYLLVHTLLRNHPADSTFAAAVGHDSKGIFSAVGTALSVPLAFLFPLASFAIFILVTLVWLIPDRRFEKLSSK
jgi:uncharacterized membrane protein